MIIAFSQLHNELEKGNLENWFRSVNSFCDKIYIYDQGSTDGSREYYKKFNNVTVIYSDSNNFDKEIFCKQKLLELLQEKEGYDNWIFWMDGDTIASNSVTKENLNALLANTKLDFIKFRHYNLWRSDLYYRVDSQYHGFFNKGVACLWKNSKNLKYYPTEGLHTQQYPGPHKVLDDTYIVEGYYLIHRGFSTDYQLLKKYEVYKSFGMSGWPLERLLDESTLIVEKLQEKVLPEWAPKSNLCPTDRPKLKDIIKNIPLIFKRGEFYSIQGSSKKYKTFDDAFKEVKLNEYFNYTGY